MMKREAGKIEYPVWLLGDSNPSRWEQYLASPLDSRHPIRHNIWTSVLDVIQDRVFRECRLRLETKNIYIRNAIEKASFKPKGYHTEWCLQVSNECKDLRALLINRPVIVLCFGAFAFEFARRASEQGTQKNHGYWSAKNLGNEFRERVKRFDVGSVNLVPMLHRSISGGRFRESHRDFCGADGSNYFDIVGNELGGILLKYQEQLDVWVS